MFFRSLRELVIHPSLTHISFIPPGVAHLGEIQTVINTCESKWMRVTRELTVQEVIMLARRPLLDRRRTASGLGTE